MRALLIDYNPNIRVTARPCGMPYPARNAGRLKVLRIHMSYLWKKYSHIVLCILRLMWAFKCRRRCSMSMARMIVNRWAANSVAGMSGNQPFMCVTTVRTSGLHLVTIYWLNMSSVAADGLGPFRIKQCASEFNSIHPLSRRTASP